MRIVIALIRKNLLDVRWMLLLIAGTLYWFCWLFVYIAHMREKLGRVRFEMTSIEFEMQFWNSNPLFTLLLGLWAISRGTALAGEMEKGTLDLIMSRPVRRTTYLVAQVFVSVLGIALIAVAMVAGNQSSEHFNPVRDPVSWQMLARPALNLAAFAWAVYGYSFLLAAVDIVRWRPILIASTLTIAGYIAHVVTNTPLVSEKYKWIDKLSIFSVVNVVEIVTTGETFAHNVSILGGIGLIGVVIGFIFFSSRDLPAGS